MSQLVSNTIKTPIIPIEQKFYHTKDGESLDYKELAVFATIGFFLGDSTHYQEKKCLNPASNYEFDNDGKLVSEKPYFEWNYAPKNTSLSQTVDEFAHLFTKLTKENLDGKNVILPLSGGLDSRSQAAVLTGSSNVNTYSYKFYNSFDETSFGKKIASINGWDFKEYTIQPGYLWNRIDQLAKINECFTDFVTPRQMSIFDEYDGMGNVFFLGHWGDVLFDDMGVPDNLKIEDQVKVIVKKIVKKGGLELGTALWKEWGLLGNIEAYISEKVYALLSPINIQNANARIRAFKSMYWAPRWTSVSLNIFKKKHPVFLPYYENEMCEFICSIPENLLSARQIQIEFIKKVNPELAKVPWQSYAPFNLYNYKKYHSKANLPNRIFKKGKRELLNLLGTPAKNVRNWEIQYLGKDNEAQLQNRLFQNQSDSFISSDLKSEFLKKFSEAKEKVNYAHSISMLLTLSTFNNSIHKP